MLISALGYGIVFLSMILFVEFVGLGNRLSFLISYMIAYVFDYFANLNVLFYKNHSNSRLFLYFFYIIFVAAIGNILFLMLESALNFNYIILTFFTMVILFPLRFVILKYVVYR